MKLPSWLHKIIATLASFALGYIRVDHPDMLVQRKGQFLILLQTLLMVTAWSNFASYIFKDFNSFFPTMQANLVYWMVTLFQLALIIVPILLAQRGKVKPAAHLMLLTSMLGLIKYAIARDFHQYNVLMMASMFVLIPIAGALLRPRASLIMAVIICGVEWILAGVLDPNIDPIVLPSMIWMNLNFGATMSIILWIYEMTIKDSKHDDGVDVVEARPSQPEDVQWVGWTVARATYEKMRIPLENMRVRLIDMEQTQRSGLSIEARNELYDMQATIQRLLKDMSAMTEVLPSGVMAVELQRFDLSASSVLDRMGNEVEGAQGTRVIIHHQPTSPNRVYVAPVALRRSIEELIQFMITRTGTNEVTIIDEAADNRWLISIRSSCALPRDRAQPMRPPFRDPALRHAAARIEAMPGTLSIDARPGLPLTMTLSIPLEAQS